MSSSRTAWSPSAWSSSDLNLPNERAPSRPTAGGPSAGGAYLGPNASLLARIPPARRRHVRFRTGRGDRQFEYGTALHSSRLFAGIDLGGVGQPVLPHPTGEGQGTGTGSQSTGREDRLQERTGQCV